MQSIFKIAGVVLKDVPYHDSYDGASYEMIKDGLRKIDFEEIHKDERFDKESGKFITDTLVFSNLQKQSIIFIKIGDEINYPAIEGGMSEGFLGSLKNNEDPEDTNNIIYIHHFYNKLIKPKDLEEIRALFKSAVMSDFKLKVRKNSINFLCFDHGFNLKNIKIKRKMENSLELNYGPDFIKVHDKLIKFLNSEETGLAILNGDKGTGKTFYIRYLLSILTKRVIYIPPHLVNKVSEPDFLSFLLRQNDFILVIEDAEEIITNRKDTNNTAGVSNLLNLSDGILGDCIRVKIITTFNAEINSIDPALLRKGRLKLQHQFDELSPDLANKLLKHLKINHETKTPMSLSDIYGFNDNNFRKEKTKEPFGFGKK